MILASLRSKITPATTDSGDIKNVPVKPLLEIQDVIDEMVTQATFYQRSFDLLSEVDKKLPPSRLNFMQASKQQMISTCYNQLHHRINYIQAPNNIA